MVEREADICEIEQEDGTIKHLSAVTILNERGEYSNCLGVMPPHWRPFAKVSLFSRVRTRGFARYDPHDMQAAKRVFLPVLSDFTKN
jgi:hypothetical protein